MNVRNIRRPEVAHERHASRKLQLAARRRRPHMSTEKTAFQKRSFIIFSVPVGTRSQAWRYATQQISQVSFKKKIVTLMTTVRSRASCAHSDEHKNMLQIPET
jgi:hypothetical protein